MKVIYVYDALCGWCYGFSPVMQEFTETHQSEIRFEVISGGMITGQRIGPIGEVAPYISWAYKEVEKACGVTFGEHFLKNILADGKTVFTSVPPAIALCVFKTYQPDSAVHFAKRLQSAVYFDGIVPEDYTAYGKLAAEYGIDAAEFVAKMSHVGFMQQAQKDFEFSNLLGVTGFPTIFIANKGKYYKIAEGYCAMQTLEDNFQKTMLLIGQ